MAGEAFPAVVEEPAGGPPKLPAGQSITGYLTDNAAQFDLGGGKHAVDRIAWSRSRCRRLLASGSPIDLGLRDAGGLFQPATPAVGVSIPKRLSDGVALAGAVCR